MANKPTPVLELAQRKVTVSVDRSHGRLVEEGERLKVIERSQIVTKQNHYFCLCMIVKVASTSCNAFSQK